MLTNIKLSKDKQQGNPGTLEQAASALRWVVSKNQMAMPMQILGGQSLPATLGQQTGVEPGTEALWEAVTHTWDHGHWRLALQRELTLPLPIL